MKHHKFLTFWDLPEFLIFLLWVILVEWKKWWSLRWKFKKITTIYFFIRRSDDLLIRFSKSIRSWNQNWIGFKFFSRCRHPNSCWCRRCDVKILNSYNIGENDKIYAAYVQEWPARKKNKIQKFKYLTAGLRKIESGWTRQIRTFGEFNFYRPEGSELAKKSASSTLDEVNSELAKKSASSTFTGQRAMNSPKNQRVHL